jgi:hypothetical protein
MARRPRNETPFVLTFSAQPGSVQDLFLRRSEHVLKRIVDTVDETVLAEALTAPTDVGTLSQVLGDLGIVGAAAEIEPLAPLVALNAQHREDLLKQAGGVLSGAEVAKLLGITRQAVDKRRAKGSLLALKKGSDWRYPRCQFVDADTVPGLAEAIRGMASSGPWVTLDFLLAPDTALGGLSPLEALTKHRTADVLRLVRAEADGSGFS